MMTIGLRFLPAAALVVVSSIALAGEPDPLPAIHGTCVGPICIGRPIPGDRLAPGAGSVFFCRFVADAQILEGFRIGTPAVLAGLDGGACKRWGRKNTGTPPEARFEKAARTLAKRAKVVVIIVESRDVRARGETGVGSTLPDLRRTFPDLRIAPIPPTFGDDECVATTAREPAIRFHFRDCPAAEKGEGVTRVLIFP
jgi:hypothetical protein